MIPTLAELEATRERFELAAAWFNKARQRLQGAWMTPESGRAKSVVLHLAETDPRGLAWLCATALWSVRALLAPYATVLGSPYDLRSDVARILLWSWGEDADFGLVMASHRRAVALSGEVRTNPLRDMRIAHPERERLRLTACAEAIEAVMHLVNLVDPAARVDRDEQANLVFDGVVGALARAATVEHWHRLQRDIDHHREIARYYYIEAVREYVVRYGNPARPTAEDFRRVQVGGIGVAWDHPELGLEYRKERIGKLSDALHRARVLGLDGAPWLGCAVTRAAIERATVAELAPWTGR